MNGQFNRWLVSTIPVYYVHVNISVMTNISIYFFLLD